MTELEMLEQRLHDENIPVEYHNFGKLPLKALYFDGIVVLSPEVKNTTEKRCILMEEYCHSLYSAGNILRDAKQEALARRKACERLVPLRALRAAKRAGCRTLYEIADHLGVTEEVLVSALDYYRSKGTI